MRYDRPTLPHLRRIRSGAVLRQLKAFMQELHQEDGKKPCRSQNYRIQPARTAGVEVDEWRITVKLTKYQREKIRARRHARDRVVAVYQAIIDHGCPVASVDLAAKIGISVQELSGRVRTANSHGANIDTIYPKVWMRGSRVIYQCTRPIDLAARMDDAIDAIAHGISTQSLELAPGIHETPTGRIYAYADLHPPKSDGYQFNRGFGVGSSLSPSLSFAL